MSIRTARALILAIPLAFSMLGCHRHEPSSDQDLLYVSAIDAPHVATAGQFFTLYVVGTKPDPAWRWVRNDIATAPSEVILTVRGDREPRAMAAQMLTDYRAPQRIRKLKPGTLKVVAIGRNGRVATTIRVVAPGHASS